jgi:hypothetical protein
VLEIGPGSSPHPRSDVLLERRFKSKEKHAMVIVCLKGGLGNQMFQYATGRRIALKNSARLKLDISWFGNTGRDIHRTYELKNFNILEEFASAYEVARLKPGNGFGSLVSRLKQKLAPHHNPYKLEKSLYFDPEILSVTGDVYLEGNWGSEKYFLDIEDILRKEFTLRQALDQTNENLAEQIRTVTSLSIHVRRGDFVTNPLTNQFHGVCSLDYYRSAVEEIVRYVKNPHLFVFSDDHQWVKENLKFEFPATVVCYNDSSKGHVDMKLMSLCKHNIIANSTFSWWAAWLNDNPDKKVIAPLRWLNKKDFDARDLFPESWIRL